MKAIIHTTIYDFEHYCEDQYVLFDQKIIETGPMTDFIDKGYEVIDGSDHLTMPSLVNGHGHIYSTFARGMSLPFNPSNFVEILEQLWWRLDSALELDDVYHSGVVYSRDTLLNGVTTIIDHHASGAIRGSLNQLKKSVVDEAGMRGVFCFETSDRFDQFYCINENIDFAKDSQSERCAGLFGMHASMTLSDDTLQKISDLIGDLPIHIHIAESKYDQSDSMLKYGKRIIERLDSYDLLKENSLLAHCLYINEQEAEIIHKRGCKVVYNVSSNMNNSVGLPDYKKLKKHKIPVLIGNDGLSTGITTEWLNLLYGMHLRYQTPNAFGLADVLAMIQGTYAYAGDLLGVKLGRLEKGYESDLLMVPYIAPTPIDVDNVFGHIFFGLANSFRPRHVWCAGKHLVCDFEVGETHLNAYRESCQSAAQVWQRLEGE